MRQPVEAEQRGVQANPYLLLSLSTLFWGANTVAARLAVGQASPMVITTMRWLVVVVVLLPLVARRLVVERAVLRRNAVRLFLMGALGFTSFNAIFYWSAHYTSAVNMGVIQGITPALVMLGSLVAYGTPIRPLQCVGLLGTLVGVVLIAARGDLEVLLHLDFNLGDVGIVVASVLYAGYTVALRQRPPLSPLVFFFGLAFAALLASVPLVGWEVAAERVQWPTPEGWALILFIGLFPSCVAQLLYIRSVGLIGPGRAGLFMNLIPIYAALLGVLLIGETFAAYHAIALACVLGGIWLAERRKR